jgi:hypothetical protein
MLIVIEKKMEITPEEHEFLYDQSDKLLEQGAKTSQLELGTSISTSLKMIQYSNDKIIDNDLLGNFKHNNSNKSGFKEGMLAIAGHSNLAIKDSETQQEDKPSKFNFSNIRLIIYLTFL